MREFELYLPESQAAELLGCHYRNVRELAEKGILGFIIMPDRKVKISEKSIFLMLKRHESA